MSRKQDYKAQIVIETLSEFPKTPTNTLARMIAEKYPIDFTYDQARSAVRYQRNEMIGRKPLAIHAERTQKMKKDAIKRFALPKTDYRKVPVYHLPKSSNRGLLLFDVHIPYHDNVALAATLAYGIEFKPNFIYLGGDIMDMYQLSRFIKDRRLRDFAGELELTRQFLQLLHDTFDCPIYYKLGNHEERYQHYMQLKAPELLGISEFELKNLLRFGEYNIHEIESRQKTRMGKLIVSHGHEFGHQIFSPVNPARGLFMKTKHTGVVGHHHITSEHSEKSIADKYIVTWSVGCLCGLNPEYFPVNNWNHGFATIEIENNGNFHFRNHRILDGVVY